MNEIAVLWRPFRDDFWSPSFTTFFAQQYVRNSGFDPDQVAVGEPLVRLDATA